MRGGSVPRRTRRVLVDPPGTGASRDIAARVLSARVAMSGAQPGGRGKRPARRSGRGLGRGAREHGRKQAA